MELPSETIQNKLRTQTMSNLRYHSIRWHERYYVNREEDPFEIKRGKLLEVGKMYNFMYRPKYEDKLAFYDHLPSVIILGHLKPAEGQTENAMGINVTFIPPKIRVKVMDRILDTFQTIAEQSTELVEQRRFSVLPNMPIYYRVAEKILKRSGFKFAIRSYIYKRMVTEPRIVTYADWWRVGTFPSQYVEKMNIRAIYRLYKKNIDPKYEIGKRDVEPAIERKSIEEIRAEAKREAARREGKTWVEPHTRVTEDGEEVEVRGHFRDLPED